MDLWSIAHQQNSNSVFLKDTLIIARFQSYPHLQFDTLQLFKKSLFQIPDIYTFWIG